MPNKTSINKRPQEIVKPKTQEELRNIIGELGTGYDARYILPEAEKETRKLKRGEAFDSKTFLYKAMTLFEFDKGILMCTAIPDRFTVFALDFSKNLQTEFECTKESEKSLAHILSLNYIRILDVQQKISAYLEMNTINPNGIGYLNIMSKELDRAQRHYLGSLQALRTLKMPPLEVSIRTQTAIVGQNQIVQSNNNDKPI